jgi:ComF family protein
MALLAWRNFAAAWIEPCLAFFYPETCQLCEAARATAAEGYVCRGCRDAIKFIQPPWCERCGMPYSGALTESFSCTNCREQPFQFSYARSAIVARDTALEIIHRYKYGRALWLEPLLAGFLIDRAGAELMKGQWDFLVPVPLHPTRQREREFNQAERLARRLTAATRIPCRTDLLRRTRATLTQTALTRAERALNVQRAFAPRRGARLSGERVVLIDDVFTTGATTGACAKVLRSLGAGIVCVWTVARGV